MIGSVIGRDMVGWTVQLTPQVRARAYANGLGTSLVLTDAARTQVWTVTSTNSHGAAPYTRLVLGNPDRTLTLNDVDPDAVIWLDPPHSQGDPE